MIGGDRQIGYLRGEKGWLWSVIIFQKLKKMTDVTTMAFLARSFFSKMLLKSGWVSYLPIFIWAVFKLDKKLIKRQRPALRSADFGKKFFSVLEIALKRVIFNPQKRAFLGPFLGVKLATSWYFWPFYEFWQKTKNRLKNFQFLRGFFSENFQEIFRVVPDQTLEFRPPRRLLKAPRGKLVTWAGRGGSSGLGLDD